MKNATAQAELERLGVNRVRLEFPDTNGSLRGKVVAATSALNPAGAGFSNVIYCLTSADEPFESPGFATAEEGWADVLGVPDWSTLRPVPNSPSVAGVMCDAVTKEGQPVPIDARTMLRSACDRLEAAQLTALCGLEFEFYLFHDGPEARRALREGRPRELMPTSTLRQGYSLQRLADTAEFVEDLWTEMAAYGVPLEAVGTELGEGMVEVALGPLPPLAAADAAARFKLGCKAIARRHGMLATFMAKWDANQSGCSGHLHISIAREGRNVSWDGRGGLSDLGRSALAGLMTSAPELSAFMSPFPNSYRRYDPAMWTPINVTWGHDNRNACLRVITVSEDAARFEHRRPGADVNPYAAVAACVDACVHGITKGLVPVAEARGRASESADAALFPTNLLAAADALEASELARRWYGDKYVDHYVLSRRVEQREWERASQDDRARAGDNGVPDWEVCRYLEVL